MKNIQYVVTAFLVLIGVFSAYADNSRITFTFTNQLDNGTYTKVAVINPAKCIPPSSRPCYYRCPVDLGPTTTEANLISAGCVPSAIKGIYRP